ncbi:MAG: ABC transporter permease [Cyclobacteriaceae bacterium]|nr:ABC transporter permease [Cyclobacteriaceae bacterium]
MLRVAQSFLLALQNIRANFFHTILSVLGIVIGVAALVSILSLIDGMEEFAKQQISTTTNLNMISVDAELYKRVNAITIRKDSVTFLQHSDFEKIQSNLSRPATCYMFVREARELTIADDTIKAAGYTTAVVGLEADTVLAGRTLDQADSTNPVGVVTESLARIFTGAAGVQNIVGKKIKLADRELTIIGVIRLQHAQGPELFFPFTLLATEAIKSSPPKLIVEATNVEDVVLLKEEVKVYLDKKFSGQHDFKITTNELRIEQATKGIKLFRIIMGLIVGISVIVGGVGVMNVLLISVTERTAEIGIRKAVGANRRDIILLFLSESITVSAFGSLLGLILGTLFTMAAIPIVKAITKVPFQAAYTFNTFLIISFIAVLVGIIFGTYPAIRASRLDPVEAIRHE